MSQALEPAAPASSVSIARVLTLWLIAGAVMIACARLASVSRTQEARVLETAREMLGKALRDWLIPHTNGDIRLHKPPLAYWLSAGAFKIFGISAWAGRLPEVLAGWMTLAATFSLARRFFDQIAALFAAAALLGSYLFFKSTLLAETDALAMAFVTGGIYAALRAIDAPRDWRWQHAIAMCMALAVLSKGPPAAYIALFYLAVCAIRRDWQPIKFFFVSGAIATLLIIAVPWFAYVGKQVGYKQLIDDLRNSAEGGKGHAGLPHVYVPMFAKAAAPWIALWAVAAAGAVRHVWRRLRPWQGLDAISTLMLWGVVIALPLMGWGNKQEHYLLPLMPPTMILVGYGIAGAISDKGRFHDLARIILFITAGLLALLPAVPIVVARVTRDHGEILAIDWLTCGVLVVISSTAFFLHRQCGRRGSAYAAVLLSVALVCVIQLEARVADSWPTETLALEMYRVYPDGKFVFRSEPSLSMCFEMGRTIPVLSDAALLARAGEKNLVCLERIDGEPKNAPPLGFVESGRIGHPAERGGNAEWLRVFVPDATGR